MGDVTSMYANAQLAADELEWTAKLGLQEMCEYIILTDPLPFLLVDLFPNNFELSMNSWELLFFLGEDLWRWQSSNPQGFSTVNGV